MPDEVTLPIELLLTAVILVINLLVLGPVGYILRQHLTDYREYKKNVYGKLDEMEDRHNELRQELPDKYVSIKRYLKEMDEIRQLLHRILDKLEGKADK